MTALLLGLPFVCFVVGMLGTLLGAWLCARSSRAQLETQRHAFELAREKAERDLHQALLCVPQWMQQTVRVELEFLGRQQTERWKELVSDQHRWQAVQDGLREAEWQALLAGSPARRPLTAPVPVPAARVPSGQAVPVTSLPRPPEPQKIADPLPSPAAEPEQELTDEEIDALPPDLPMPTRVPGRKLQAPKRPVLRNL